MSKKMSEYDENRPLTTGEKIYALLMALNLLFVCYVVSSIFYFGAKQFIENGGIWGLP